MTDREEFQAHLQRLEALVQQSERLPDPAARMHCRNLVQALLDVHAAGLEQMLDRIAKHEPEASVMVEGRASTAPALPARLIEDLVHDEIISGLLLLHDLHPHSIEERVQQVVEEFEDAIELIDIEEGIIRLKWASEERLTPKLREKIEERILARAPDAAGIEFEGYGEPVLESSGRFALAMV